MISNFTPKGAMNAAIFEKVGRGAVNCRLTFVFGGGMWGVKCRRDY